MFYFSHFSFLLWINAAFFSLSYFLRWCTTQGCARPRAVFLLSCFPLQSVLIAAVAQILHFSFAIAHIFYYFSSCGKYPSWWAGHRYKSSNDKYNPIKDSSYTLAICSANRRMGLNGGDKDLQPDLMLKSAFAWAGGWTSWGPYNLNYCMVPNIAFFPKNSLKRRVRLPKDAWSISSSSPSGLLHFILSPKQSTLESTARILGFFPKELKKYQVPISLKCLHFFLLYILWQGKLIMMAPIQKTGYYIQKDNNNNNNIKW